MIDEISSNKRKSMLVFFTFLIFCGLIFFLASLIFGYVYYTKFGVTIFNVFFIRTFIVLSIITAIYLVYFFKKGDTMVLRITGAKKATKQNYAQLTNIVEGLSISAGISKPPDCYVIEDTALNAFATGFKPEKSYIVVTTGLLKNMNKLELEGVVAHEMSHILNQDAKLMLYVAGLIGIFTLIGTVCFHTVFYSRYRRSSNNKDSSYLYLIMIVLWILFSVIGVFFATVFKFALSRKREFLADANGAHLTRYPKGLANALRKISNDPDPLVDKANKATAHLFISTPFRKKKTVLTGLFSTHPPIEERIKRLEEM